MGQLDGKVAVITGAASGIGAGTCRMFVREGARVVIADILHQDGEALAADLGEAAAYVHTDVTSEPDVANAVATATERFGRIDCLFNNAGAGGTDADAADVERGPLESTIALLFNGVVYGMKHASRAMRAQGGGGSIISTASVAALQAGFGPHIYSAMKAAVIQLTKTVGNELGESGIRVNCICPGGIVTPIFARALGLDESLIKERTAILNEVFSVGQPIRRAGQPEDIAAAAVFLASDASSFVNGHALVVDGGLTTGRNYSETRQGFDAIRELLGTPPRE
ncbi:MAG: glucose 1-dehydrogenase [Myxococcales bacterium]|jgi:NAD(P)-dependent dehydrogenase (short-subunit alcohol dehydrogenase family)|nr:MAG: glucose 1-dehydrogenase [Myxococcales bacterium]